MSSDTQETHCPAGECIAGEIGGANPVMVKDWRDAVLKFEGKIELWNELTKRHAIPHIGYIDRFNFCTQCGKKIELPPTAQELQALMGELYQVLGGLDAPAKVLDKVSAASCGEPIPPGDLLPFVVEAD